MHNAITEMYTQGMKDQIIRKMVGWHPSSKMPDIYVHIKEQQMILDQLNALNPNKAITPIKIKKNNHDIG